MKFKSAKQRKAVMATIRGRVTIKAPKKGYIQFSNKQGQKVILKNPVTADEDFGLEPKDKAAIEKEVDSKIVRSYDEQRGTIYEFENGEEWLIFEDEDKANDAAIDYVEEMLQDEPESFEKNWLEGHIDTDHLRDELESDVSDSNYNYYNDIESESDSHYQNRLVSELVDLGFLDESDVMNEDNELKDEDEIASLVEKSTVTASVDTSSVKE